MKNKPGRMILDAEEKAALQAIATRLGEQIGQMIADSLGDMLSVVKKNRRQSVLLPPMNRDEFLTAGDVAKSLKISKSQAYHMIRIGEIPSFSIGRIVRVRRMDLEAVIESHMTIKERSLMKTPFSFLFTHR